MTNPSTVDSDFSSRSARWLLAVLLPAALLAALASPAHAQFRDIGYTFEPTAHVVFDDDNSVFRDEALYGGALGLSFGRYFQVSGEYLVNTGLEADFAEVEPLQGLLPRTTDVRRYGARLRVNLYDRRVIPHLTAGTGALQFNPDAAELSRTIYGLAGGGITFSVQNRYRFTVGGEILTYRYDPVATFLGPSGAEDFDTGTRLVSTPALNASVSLFLGGRSLEERTAVDEALNEQFGGGGFFDGVRLYVNPFYGRIEFGGELGFPKDQNMTGVNAGVDLGPYVGLRGFYWRGATGADVTDEFADGFEDIQAYGGELQLRLNAELGRGFVPYVKLGGGYLDVDDTYADALPEGAVVPEDRFFATTGGGLEVPLTQSFKLSGGARLLWMDNPNVVEAGDPGTVKSSLMYTAGLEFRLGGGEPARAGTPTEPLLGDAEADPAAAPADPASASEAATSEAAPTAEAPQAGALSPLERELLARTDSLSRALERLRADTAATPTVAARSNLSGQTMQVPIPENGEIYIRFGDGVPQVVSGTGAAPEAGAPATGAQAGELSASEMERLVRESLRRQLRQRADTSRTLSQGDVDRLVQQTLRNMQQRNAETESRAQRAQQREIEQLQREIEELRRLLRERATAPREQAAPPAQTVTTTTRDVPFYRETLGRPLTYLVPMVGFRAGEGPDQAQLGIRGDYRQTPESRLHFLPELTLGLGGGEIAPTVLLQGAFSFAREALPQVSGQPIEPYVGAGVGIASDGGFTFEPVTSLLFGTSYRLQGGSTLFLEYSTLDVFNTSRVHVGYRIRL